MVKILNRMRTIEEGAKAAQSSHEGRPDLVEQTEAYHAEMRKFGVELTEFAPLDTDAEEW
jgi:hypothetical protein